MDDVVEKSKSGSGVWSCRGFDGLAKLFVHRHRQYSLYSRHKAWHTINIVASFSDNGYGYLIRKLVKLN